MGGLLEDQLELIRDLLEEAINAENEKPPDVSTSESKADTAINSKVHGVIISSSPPNLTPTDAGHTSQTIVHSTRLEFLGDFKDMAAEAYNEEATGDPSDHDYIGELLWKIWNSRDGLFNLY